METKNKNSKKKAAPPCYDEAFRAGAVRMVTEQGPPSKEVAQELGICVAHAAQLAESLWSTDGSGRPAKPKRLAETGVRGRSAGAAQKPSEKDEVIELLKNPSHNFQTVEDKYRYVKAVSKRATPTTTLWRKTLSAV